MVEEMEEERGGLKVSQRQWWRVLDSLVGAVSCTLELQTRMLL